MGEKTAAVTSDPQDQCPAPYPTSSDLQPDMILPTGSCPTCAHPSALAQHSQHPPPLEGGSHLDISQLLQEALGHIRAILHGGDVVALEGGIGISGLSSAPCPQATLLPSPRPALHSPIPHTLFPPAHAPDSHPLPILAPPRPNPPLSLMGPIPKTSPLVLPVSYLT